MAPIRMWPADSWWRNFTPRLVAMGELDEADGAAMILELDRLASSPHNFLVLPPVFELMAVKR